MNASRSPGSSRDHSARKFASEPPLTIVTLFAVASGYHAATFERVSSDPSERGYPSFVARKDSASAAKPAKRKLPTKLIISATKRQLDQVASGRMTLEEFRQAISSEEE